MKNLPKTKAEAKAIGARHYFTGEPCKRGHLAKRVVHGDCVECKRLIGKEWRSSNSEKIKQHRIDYYQANSEKIKKRAKDYHHANREECNDKSRRRHHANREERNKKSRDYHHANREELLIKKRDYHHANRERIKIIDRSRYSGRREAVTRTQRSHRKRNQAGYFARSVLCRVGGNYLAERFGGISLEFAEGLAGYTSEDLIEHLEALFVDGMDWSNREEWHIDHIIPVAQFRDNVIEDVAYINHLSNLAPLWASDNQSKSGDRVRQEDFDAYMDRVQRDLGFEPRTLEELKAA